MSMKIRISYETDEELLQIQELLAPLRMKLKYSPTKGNYKRAYMDSPDVTRHRRRYEPQNTEEEGDKL